MITEQAPRSLRIEAADQACSRSHNQRKRIQAYLRADGERSSAIRTIVTRSRQFLPKIEADLALVKELVQAYERSKAK